jgi:putative transposase
VKAVTEELCGHEFSASAISGIVKKLDASLKAFCERRLTEAYPYLILDARYERVREDGGIVSQAVLIAVAVDWEGRRGARSWPSISPTARVRRAGRTFF